MLDVVRDMMMVSVKLFFLGVAFVAVGVLCLLVRGCFMCL